MLFARWIREKSDNNPIVIDARGVGNRRVAREGERGAIPQKRMQAGRVDNGPSDISEPNVVHVKGLHLGGTVNIDGNESGSGVTLESADGSRAIDKIAHDGGDS